MTTAIILAAGSSSRMGRQKLLMELNGKAIMNRVIEQVTASNCFDEIILVYYEYAVKQAAEGYDLKLVHNPSPVLGLSSSLKLGIEAADERAGEYMFFMGDQPFISPAIIEKLMDEYSKTEKSILIPVYNGSNGMPTIFSSKWKVEFMELSGDTGGREIVKKHPEEVCYVEQNDSIAGMDIDTHEAYQKALKIVKANS
ncbi:MAG: nucleotidyltransferase family protein [Bacillota bacterium]